MGNRDSLLKRHEVFISASCLASHSSFHEEGFRQRDVRFFLELFWNWIYLVLGEEMLEITNMQIARFIESLVEEGLCRKITRTQKYPRYRLTRVGILELLQRIADPAAAVRPGAAFFVYYFLHNHGARIEDLIEQEGSQFPEALRIEIEPLLDAKRVLTLHRDIVASELRKLDARIEESLAGETLAKKMFDADENLEAVALAVEKAYPYELNSQKALSELLSSLPAEQARWELEIGGKRRVNHLFAPSKAVLQSYLAELDALIKG